MYQQKCKNCVYYVLFTIAAGLIIIGIILLEQSITRHNVLFLQYEDKQLQEATLAADQNMAYQLSNMQNDLAYTLSRRGFLQGEKLWTETGDTTELLKRMQENLVAYNPLIQNILAIKDGEIILSNNGITEYFFPFPENGTMQPCYSVDGTLYLALITHTEDATYAALLDLSAWYDQLSLIYNTGETKMMLLGGQEKFLLHHWEDTNYVMEAEKVTTENCDVLAVQKMIESHAAGISLTDTYQRLDQGDDFAHEMRICILPVKLSSNGYFTIALTSHYDEIIRPIQNTAYSLIVYGGLLMTGVLLMAVLTWRLFLRNRHKDREMQQLTLKNQQMQQLLEKTQELAHHQRLETLGTLTSSIAHEFNNLLTPIMGYAILTLEGLPDDADELADHVTEIYEASRKAKDIIARLGELSRKNSEQNFRCLSLEKLCSKAIQVASPALPSRVSVTMNCDDSCCVMGSELQLSQMLLNLIINAYHAMEENGGMLTLRVTQVENEAHLTVSDTGCGISQEALPNIFDPFFTTKGPGKGTGLGLAIVHQVVESHQGTLDVQSRMGEGTIFTVRLPLAEDTRIANS